MSTNKSKWFQIRTDDAWKLKVKELAEDRGKDQAQVVREMVEKAHQAMVRRRAKQ